MTKSDFVWVIVIVLAVFLVVIMTRCATVSVAEEPVATDAPNIVKPNKFVYLCDDCGNVATAGFRSRSALKICEVCYTSIHKDSHKKIVDFVTKLTEKEVKALVLLLTERGHTCASNGHQFGQAIPCTCKKGCQDVTVDCITCGYVKTGRRVNAFQWGE